MRTQHNPNEARAFRGTMLAAAVLLMAAAGTIAAAEKDKDAEKQAPDRYPTSADGALPTADGFRGIWYANQPSGDKYKFKYSGGLGTYPQQHYPQAVYSKAANKTFFVYGGRYKEENRLLHMISYFDHETGQVARPRVLLDKGTDDAHDNPVLQIDEKGYLWIFSNAHGTSRPSYIHRSAKPHAIDAFKLVKKTNFSYGQPWRVPGEGLVLLHTLYHGGRWLHVARSENGLEWSEPKLLAKIDKGQYQVSARHGNKLGTAFNHHPDPKGLNWRTNLYYMETTDGGRTWRNIHGETLDLPLTEPKNPALALDYASKDRLVYLKNVRFTKDGRPVILYMTSEGYESGPDNDPRTFKTARWTGSEWDVHEVTDGDNNYDYASLYIEHNHVWRIIGTTETGPQPYNTGGEMAVWTSRDQGETWEMTAQLTEGSKLNHTYPRKPIDAHPGFYALWADGHGRKQSKSRLYFCTKDGEVFRLPRKMEGDFAKPEQIR